MDIQDFLEAFNNGDLDVERYFRTYDNWFNLLKKKGLIGEIDPHNAVDNEVWQNQYLLWLYYNDRENFYKWVEKLLGDIEVDKETKKVYWVGDREDLSELFCSGHRYDISQDTIKNILSDDGDWWESHWDTTDNVYRDVIDELNEKNLDRLKERIFDELKGQQLSPETEVMETIATNQGHPEYWEINSENVVAIIDDEESMNSLLDDELSDLKSDLFIVHSDSYNSAHQDDVWEEIWKELNEYFEGKGEWVSIPHPFKENTTVQKYKIPISDFEGFIGDYLDNNKGYGNSGTIEYYGSYLGLLKESGDCLSIRVPDYPDFRKVDKNLNLYFEDYI